MPLHNRERTELWMEAGVCLDPSAWEIMTPPIASIKAAKAVCATCIVREECLDWAVNNQKQISIFEVWGGKTGPERNDLLRSRASQGSQ